MKKTQTSSFDSFLVARGAVSTSDQVDQFGQIEDIISTSLGESNWVHCFFRGKELMCHRSFRGLAHDPMDMAH